MKRLSKIVTFIAFAGYGIGQSVVVPNTNAGATGNDTSGTLNPPLSGELQIVIAPSQLPSGTVNITGFAFRPAPGLGALSLTLVGSVHVSNSPNWPNSTGHTLISNTFSNNVGGNNTLVSSGTATMSGAACATPGPCSFTNPLVFTTPFTYNGTNGPLLLDLQASSFGSPTGQMDVIDCPNTSCTINSLFATPLGTSTGSINAGSSIIQLTYTTSTSSVPSTPAPPSVYLTLLGLTVLGFYLVARRFQVG